MVELTKIPNEVVAQIFNCLENVQDLKQCQLTCKEWSIVAQEKLYKTITLTDDKHAKSFFHTISQSPSSPGQYTKKITMHSRYFPESSNKWDPHGYFKLITKYLPYVQILDISLQPSMIKWLIEERLRGNFQHIRRFWVSKTTPATTSLLLTYRDTLERLYLSDGATENSPKPQAPQVKEYKRIMDKVDELKGIKDLILEIFTNKNLFKLETYTAKFSQLESITYTAFRNKLDDLTANEGVITDLSLIIPMPALKKLIGSKITLTEYAGAYLMHKFPNINQLTLNKMNYDITYQYPCTMSQETMTQFMQFVAKMPFFDIQFSPKQMPINRVIKMFMDANVKKDIFLMIVYSNSQSRDSYPFTRFSKPSVYPSLKWPGVTNDNTSIIEAHFDRWRTVSTDGTVALPHMALLDDLGTGLKHLAIEAGSKYDDMNEEVDLFQREIRNSMDKIIQKCTDLNTTTLQLCESDFWANGRVDPNLKNISITRLELEYSHIHHGGFSFFNQSLTSLRYLTLSESEYFDENGIDMSNQILENFTWTKPYRDLNGKVFLHIMDAIGDDYKTIDHDGIKPCSKRIFENASNGYDNLCIRIRCEYLRTITIAYMNFNKTCMAH